MISLHAELDARPQSRADFARLAAGWLTDARRRLFPDLDPGPAGAVPAWLRVHQQPEALGGTATAYPHRGWPPTLARLERAVPFHVTLALTPARPHGPPGARA